MQFNNSSSRKKQNMTTLRLIKSVGRSPSRLALLLLPLVFACFALSQSAQGVVPPPDGGYPGGNTAEGQNALLSLTTGPFNTAVGWLSLGTVTTGQLNTAIGAGALFFNTADGNTATGAGALLSNTSGFDNTANGSFALANNLGVRNTAVGREALFSNIGGANNTAIGQRALFSNDEGDNNTAVGKDALQSNTTGQSNVAVGRGALANNTAGVSNTALGIDAGNQVHTASNVICISHTGANVSDTAWFDNIYGMTTVSGMTAPVIVSDHGQLGTIASSERFKKDISTMEKASETILSLRPVTFHYKTDTTGIPQFGLIAEEVAKVNPALVLPDKEGKPYTVRYDQVNAMLLNEFLKEHKRVQVLEATVAQQQKGMEVLTARLNEQAAQIQKVSAQLEASKPAPQVVNNP
jgi:hypothetical protein